MGMDLTGQNPTAPVGEYFRASVWGWHPLWIFCEDIAPKLAKKVKNAHYNAGDGLGAADAVALAAAITEALDRGWAAKYVTLRDWVLDAMPRVPCNFCDATGVRRDAIGVANGLDTRITTLPDGSTRRGWCNGCDGCGDREDTRTWYRTDVESIARFRDFVAASGGFEIH